MAGGGPNARCARVARGLERRPRSHPGGPRGGARRPGGGEDVCRFGVRARGGSPRLRRGARGHPAAPRGAHGLGARRPAAQMARPDVSPPRLEHRGGPDADRDAVGKSRDGTHRALAPCPDVLRTVRPAPHADRRRPPIPHREGLSTGDPRAPGRDLHRLVPAHVCDHRDGTPRDLGPRGLDRRRAAGGASNRRTPLGRGRRPPGRRRAGGRPAVGRSPPAARLRIWVRAASARDARGKGSRARAWKASRRDDSIRRARPMGEQIRARWWLTGILLAALAASSAWGASPTPKYGGVLNAMHREDPPSLSIHEGTTVSTQWPMMSCYNNLVLFSALRGQESPATIVGELAESWTWRDDGKALVFTLRQGVRWHDGRPFSSKDVKYTFDVIRGALGPSGLRLNPRRDWYSQVQAIDAPDPSTVIFRLKRPQPSFLMLLASGYSPIYPAHVPPAELRARCVGTGPFKLKEYRPGELIEMVRNPDYFVKGRPYLDGIRFIIIKERGTRIAALQTGRLDVTMPQEGSKTAAEQLKKAVPGMVIFETSQNVNDNLLMNFKRPPFTDTRVRRAISLAIDRQAYVQAVRPGGGPGGGSMLPRPRGGGGLAPPDPAGLPGR